MESEWEKWCFHVQWWAFGWDEWVQERRDTIQVLCGCTTQSFGDIAERVKGFCFKWLRSAVNVLLAVRKVRTIFFFFTLAFFFFFFFAYYFLIYLDTWFSKWPNNICDMKILICLCFLTLVFKIMILSDIDSDYYWY